MPSGAKKRKAAKKKKDQQAHNNSNSSSINDSHAQGNDDPKSQDERESDGGEVDSPASQDHQNQHHSFDVENEEYEKRVQSSFVTEDKPIDRFTGDAEGSQNTGVEDERIIKIEKEVNLVEKDIESVHVIVEHVESVKELHDVDYKSSSRSSSVDKSRAQGKNWKEEYYNSASDAISYNNVEKVFPEEVTEESRTEKPLIEANGNSVMETAPAIDLAASVVPMSKVGKHVMEGAQFENAEVLDVLEPGMKENDDNLLPKSNDVVADLVPEENKEKVYPILDENVGASTIVGASSLNGYEDKILNSSSVQTSYAENIKDSETSDGTVTNNEGKILGSSGAHTSEASKDVDRAKDFEASEHIETQRLVPPASQIEQRTSWLSCCGLFDVFTGSDR